MGKILGIRAFNLTLIFSMGGLKMGGSSGVTPYPDNYDYMTFDTAGPFNAIVTGPGHIGTVMIGLGNTAGQFFNLYDSLTAGTNFIASIRINGTQAFSIPLNVKFNTGLSIDNSGTLGTYNATVMFRQGA